MKVYIKKNILIQEKDVLSLDAVINAKENNMLESELRNKFVDIIRYNTADGGVIKLVDLKNSYQSLLVDVIGDYNINIVQILKNLTSSNKDNKTHLVRDKNIGWIYVERDQINKQVIEYKESDKKPFPLPVELERSRTKRYYVYYLPELNDSPQSAFDQYKEDQEFVIKEQPETKYGEIDFSTIKRSKIDFVEKQELAQKTGLVGEEYVFKYERQYCLDNDIDKEVVWVASQSDLYGFDILSYRVEQNGDVYPIYIEVKTTTGNLDSNFYVTKNELETSKREKNYHIYRVFNASDEQTIQFKSYKGSFENNFKLIRVEETFVFKAQKE